MMRGAYSPPTEHGDTGQRPPVGQGVALVSHARETRAAGHSSLTSPSGLVSVPTSVAGRSEALRGELGAFAPDPHRSRIAKLRRAVGFAARGHLAERRGFRPDTCFMVTLTYREGVEWRPRHLSACRKLLAQWLKKRGIPCRYVWVAELQKRGAVHYHLALFLPPDVYLPSADLAGWWPHGSTRTERARAAVPYLMKYLSKGSPAEALQLPQGARMYGVGGLEHSLRRARRWLGLPGFVRARSDCFDDWRPAKGGGWVTPDDVVIPSEYQRAWVGDRYSLIRVADYGRPFSADGPFTWLERRPC